MAAFTMGRHKPETHAPHEWSYAYDSMREEVVLTGTANPHSTTYRGLPKLRNRKFVTINLNSTTTIVFMTAAPQEPITLYSPSKRVKLASPTPEYDEAIAALRSAPTTLRYLKWLPDTLTAEDAKEMRESRAKEPHTLYLYAFALNDAGAYELVGSTGAFNVDSLQKSGEGGIIVGPEHLKKGLATEIWYTLFEYYFEKKGYHRLVFDTEVKNEPMRGWLEKVGGIRFEGVKKEWWTDRRGGWVDVASYALLEREWRDEVKERLERRLEANVAR